jgi:CheY-like chemotaxis protein
LGAGYEVRVACSGSEGLEAGFALQPRILLCDIGLLGMDGFAVAGALRPIRYPMDGCLPIPGET